MKEQIMVSRVSPKRRPWNTLRANFEFLKCCNLIGRFWRAYFISSFCEVLYLKANFFPFISLDTMRIVERATDRQDAMTFLLQKFNWFAIKLVLFEQNPT